MARIEENLMQPGSILDGKYRIDKQIGAGGMGAVHIATHVQIGRKVAIKTLHPIYAGDQQTVERFHREAQMAGSIGHDNICEVTDLGTAADGSLYLVMPLLSGMALSDLLARPDRPDIPRIADIAAQTLSALQAAHDAHIVHRDLKPDNIFITKVGDRDDFVKLLDFGISKLMDSEEVTRLTQTGTVLGTPFYMAPEQAKGAKDLDHRVDIYAMGVILYEALTGEPPFNGDSYNEIMYKIIAEPFTAPSELNPDIPPAIEQVVLRAMAREPEDRYGNALEMREAMELAAVGATGKVNTPAARAATVMTPNPQVTASKLVDTGAGTVGMDSVARPTVDDGRIATVEHRSSKLPWIIVVCIVVVGIVAAALFFVLGGEPAPTAVAPGAPPPPGQFVTPEDQPSAPEPVESPAPSEIVADPPPDNPRRGARKPPEKASPEASPPASAESAPLPASESVAATTEPEPQPDTDGAETPAKKKAKKKPGKVKGRFGTTFTSDYD